MKKCILLITILGSFEVLAVEPKSSASVELDFTKEIPSKNIINQCKSNDAKKSVVIIKQWHLDPKQITTPDKGTMILPQLENQVWIYGLLADWTEKKKLKTVFVEGCEGEMTLDFKDKFNGWSITDLVKKNSEPTYANIMTHIGLKLEAKYPKILNTVCAEKLSLIKDQMLAFSDLRGLVGFATRIIEHDNSPDRQSGYVEAAIKTLNLTPGQKAKVVIDQIKSKALTKVESIQKIMQLRNDTIIETISTSASTQSALVIGGIHAADLLKKMNDLGFACVVVEPQGYKQNEESLMSELTTQINNWKL
jgi:hypothetical protein